LNDLIGMIKGYITLFDLSNALMSLNRYAFSLYCNHRGVLTKLIAVKVNTGVVYNQIRGIKISIKLISIKSLPGSFCKYIFQKLGGGKSYSLINDMEYWLAVNIEDINEYHIIKVQIVRKLELESI
jgi:hypothetical protein